MMAISTWIFVCWLFILLLSFIAAAVEHFGVRAERKHAAAALPRGAAPCMGARHHSFSGDRCSKCWMSREHVLVHREA